MCVLLFWCVCVCVLLVSWLKKSECFNFQVPGVVKLQVNQMFMQRCFTHSFRHPKRVVIMCRKDVRCFLCKPLVGSGEKCGCTCSHTGEGWHKKPPLHVLSALHTCFLEVANQVRGVHTLPPASPVLSSPPSVLPDCCVSAEEESGGG